MWIIKKNNRANVISELEYDDFASLRIEKTFNGKIKAYALHINIYSILNEELIFYKLEDMSSILSYIKQSIEYFAKNINDLSDKEYDEWIDNFIRKINEY